MRLRLVMAVFLLSAAFPLFSQNAPAAHEGGLPLVIGGGVSRFDIDWGAGRSMLGGTIWIDYYPNHLPSFLRGLGVEATARDINYDRPAGIPKLRMDTVSGGPIYTWYHYRNFHPYGKYLIGLGSIDFPPLGAWDHDTRTVSAPGGGIEYRAYRNIWVRADYEYQFWPQMFGPTTLTPHGVTIGASYDLRHLHRH